MDDYRKFCIKCGWNDDDYGCTSPSGEEVYQCPMYMHYHPEEVKKFDEAMEKWAQKEEDNSIPTESQYEDEYERCWQTGEYDDYYCTECPHNYECNGEGDE